VSSYEKFVMDADQLGTLHHLAKGVSVDDNAQAMGAIREVGPGGHYLGCQHTQDNFKSAFWRSDLLDYDWPVSGCRRCWGTIRPRRWTRASAKSWKTMWRARRPRFPMHFSEIA